MSVTNIISEAAFAGSRARNATCHGNEPLFETLASNHVLAASKTIVDTARENFLSRTIHTPRAQPKTLSAWHGFLRANRNRATMEELGLEWDAMDMHARSEYNTAAPAPVAPPAPRVFRRPWPYCCDDFYPVAADKLDDLQKVFFCLI